MAHCHGARATEPAMDLLLVSVVFVYVAVGNSLRQLWLVL